MEFLRYQRPMPSMNPDGPSYEPQNQFGDFGGDGGGRMGMNNYLQGLGWGGQPGTRRDFLQGLRADGQHPWMDYFRNMHPQMGNGQSPYPPNGNPGPLPPGMGSNPWNNEPPHPQVPMSGGWDKPMQANTQAPVSGGLMSLMNRKRPPFIQS